MDDYIKLDSSPSELTPKAISMMLYATYDGRITNDPKRRKTGRMAGAYQIGGMYSCFDGACGIGEGISLWDVSAVNPTSHAIHNSDIPISHEFNIGPVFADKAALKKAINKVMAALSGK